MTTTREMLDKALVDGCKASGLSVKVGIDADAYGDLRNATPEELLAAAEWSAQQNIRDPWQLKQALAFLREGFDLARPGGWERVAPAWLRESRKLAALDQ